MVSVILSRRPFVISREVAHPNGTGVRFREPAAYPGYWVGTDGELYAGKVANPLCWVWRGGWLCGKTRQVGLSRPGSQQRVVGLGRLVLAVWTEETRDPHEWMVGYLDEDPNNCALANLYWKPSKGKGTRLPRRQKKHELSASPATYPTPVGPGPRRSCQCTCGKCCACGDHSPREEAPLRKGEVELLKYLCNKGWNLKQISDRMYISEGLLQRHIDEMFASGELLPEELS